MLIDLEISTITESDFNKAPVNVSQDSKYSSHLLPENSDKNEGRVEGGRQFIYKKVALNSRKLLICRLMPSRPTIDSHAFQWSL